MINNDSASNTNQITQEFGNRQITDVTSQTSPPKAFQLQNSGTATEQFREKSGNEHVRFLDSSNSSPTDTQKSKRHVLTTPGRDSSISVLTSTTPHIEEKLMRDKWTNELYLPLTSTVVFKCKQEMLYVPLDFDNNLTLDALVDSGAYVSAIVQNE